jgi:von Willebrand factor type A domain
VGNALLVLLRSTFSKQILFVLALLLLTIGVDAQAKKTRILFLMDASSSMTYDWQTGKTRFQAAADVVGAIIDSMSAINNEVEFAIRVYGDRFGSTEKNCVDTRVLVPFNLRNVNQIKAKLKYVEPLGSSPIAYSLEQAADNELSNTDEYDYSFVLVTDGGESCGGNICETFKKILANKVKVAPYIIGLDTNSLLKSYYECLGQFVSVIKTTDIPKAAELIVKNNRPLLDKPKVLNLKPEPIAVKPLPVVVDAVVDELRVIQRAPMALLINNSRPPTRTIIIKNTVTFPAAITVTVAPQLDAMSSLPMVPASKIPMVFTRELNVSKLRTGKPRLPAELFAEKTEDGFAMNYLQTGGEVKANTPAIKNKEGKKIGLIKAVLPKEIAEIEMGMYLMERLENTFAMKAIASKDFEKKASTKKISTPSLPKEITEPEMVFYTLTSIQPDNKLANFASKPNSKNATLIKPRNIALPKDIIEEEYVPVTMQPVLNARPRGLTITSLSMPVGKPRKETDVKLPSVFTEAPFVPTLMDEVYSIPFRFTYRSIPVPEFLNKRSIKPTTFPEKLIAPKKVAVIPTQSNEKPDFKITTEDAEDTRIAVYFIDNDGKVYNSRPTIALVDPTTKKTIKTFMREVLTNGDPDPVKVDVDGSFDVTVMGQKDIVLENVPIVKNKLNKIILKVTRGTLIFTYQNNRTRPVNFDVKVRRQFSLKKVEPVYYNTLEQKQFEPGEYQIEINILPKYVLHTEISFGAITEVQIPQEGALQINSSDIGSPVTLYYQTGDTYEEFLTVPMKGELAKQKITLRPGLYKASFVQPGMPKTSPPTIISFQVKTNQETVIELKDYKGLMVTPDAIGKPIYINEKPKVDFINTAPDLKPKPGTPKPAAPKPAPVRR